MGIDYYALLQKSKNEPECLPGLALVRHMWREPLPVAEWIDYYRGTNLDRFRRGARSMCERMDSLPAESQYLVTRHLLHRTLRAVQRGGGDEKRRILLLVLVHRQTAVPIPELLSLIENTLAGTSAPHFRSELHYACAVLVGRRDMDDLRRTGHLRAALAEAARSGNARVLQAAYYRVIRCLAASDPADAMDRLDDALDVLHDVRWMDLLCHLADRLESDGDFDESFTCRGAVVEHFIGRLSRDDADDLGALAMNLLGACLRHAALARQLGRPAEGEECLQRVLDLVRLRPELPSRAASHVVLGSFDPRQVFFSFLIEALLQSAENNLRMADRVRAFRSFSQARVLASRCGYDFQQRIEAFQKRRLRL